MNCGLGSGIKVYVQRLFDFQTRDKCFGGCYAYLILSHGPCQIVMFKEDMACRCLVENCHGKRCVAPSTFNLPQRSDHWFLLHMARCLSRPSLYWVVLSSKFSGEVREKELEETSLGWRILVSLGSLLPWNLPSLLDQRPSSFVFGSTRSCP